MEVRLLCLISSQAVTHSSWVSKSILEVLPRVVCWASGGDLNLVRKTQPSGNKKRASVRVTRA